MGEAKKQAVRQKSAVRALLVRPVAFHPVLARLAGSVNAGLMLSQALYWSERTEDRDGWFYKRAEEWTEEICLTRTQQDSARKKLVELGLMETKLRGMPAIMHYRVDIDRICEAVSQFAENQQSSLQESSNPVCRKPANKDAGKPQASFQETTEHDCGKPANMTAGNLQAAPITTETTAETTTDSRSDAATIVQAMSQWGVVSAAAAAEMLRCCRQRDARATAEEVAEFIWLKGQSIGDSVRNPIGLLLKTIPDCFEGAGLAAVREGLRRRRLPTVSGANANDSSPESLIVGRCPGCHRPRLATSTWSEYCSVSCEQEHQRRLANEDHTPVPQGKHARECAERATA